MKNLRPLALLTWVMMLVLTACGTSEPPADAASGDDSGGSAAGPVSVTDARGKTIELEEPADRVVALSWMQTESLVTLGVMPVAIADRDSYADWVASAPIDESVEGVGTRNEPSVQSILKARPDVVIADSARPTAVVERLEEQGVPVVVTETTDASDQLGTMKDAFTTIAAVVGKSEKAEQVLDELDRALAEGREAIAEAQQQGEARRPSPSPTAGSTAATSPSGCSARGR